jgi:hypothetical protein
MSITRVAVQGLLRAGNKSRYTKFYRGHWRSVAVQIISKPEIYHGVGLELRADARVRVHMPLQSCLGSRSKSKNRDKQLTHIVRVICRLLFIFNYI